MVKTISIEELAPGMVITQITRQNGPVKIRKSGLVSSEEMVKGLAEMGVIEVEVDPSQQVHIDATSTPHMTQTQQLIRDDYRRQDDIDHSLSDQFNRSLFLPTVESLPSLWKTWARQAVVVGVIVSGGYAIGWTAATSERWLPSLLEPAYIATVPSPQPSMPPNSLIDGQVQSTPVTTDSQPSSDDSARLPETSRTNQSDVATDDADTQPIMVGASPSESGVLLNAEQSASSESNVISAELLERFNQAVKELDEAPQEEDSYSVNVESTQPDIPRIDQLPARTMTRLPSMSFSAHMYSSDPQNRWVSVNGKRLTEGDWLDRDIQLVRIEPQKVILSYQGEPFSMSALTDW